MGIPASFHKSRYYWFRNKVGRFWSSGMWLHFSAGVIPFKTTRHVTLECKANWLLGEVVHETSNLCKKRFERSTIKYCVVQIPALSGLFFMSVCLLFIIITGAAHHMFAIKKNASLGNMNKPTPYNKEMLAKRVFFGFFITFIHYFIAFSEFNWVAGVR